MLNHGGHCEVCGKKHLLRDCDPATLRAIDAAHTRAERQAEDPNCEASEFWRTEASRLRDGFRMLHQYDLTR